MEYRTSLKVHRHGVAFLCVKRAWNRICISKFGVTNVA
jgi:hypothetical protein